jgi:hypothetical protein
MTQAVTTLVCTPQCVSAAARHQMAVRHCTYQQPYSSSSNIHQRMLHSGLATPSSS